MGWRQAKTFVQVDPWRGPDAGTYQDIANVPARHHAMFMSKACKIGRAVVKRGWAQSVIQCRGNSTECARKFEDASLDFVYLDARHDRQSVLLDLQTYWPKIRIGGVFAGHDYTE